MKIAWGIVLGCLVLCGWGLERFAGGSEALSQAAAAQDRNPPDLEARLVELGLSLPPPPPPVGVYRRVVMVGNLAYVSGHLPLDDQGQVVSGTLGQGLTVAEGQQAARQTALAILASLRAELGTLNRIKRLVKTTGMVRCTPEFSEQPAVINGCSELFRDLLGAEAGVGVRAAVGMNALPRGAAVEIEAIFELHAAE